MANRINPDDIDEKFLLASVKKDKVITSESESASQFHTPPPPVSADKKLEETASETTVFPETTKEESKRKRSKSQDYESIFIKESNITARLGKTVYIRKEFHDRIMKITQVIGGNELSLFSYIDNILAHHFETFQDDISQSYRQKNSDNIF
jgi:hypothetical protein